MENLNKVVNELKRIQFVISHEFYIPTTEIEFPHRESDRNKAIKLLSKICQNLINNPTQTQKYGHLNFDKINKKLSKCKPAMDLLYLSGFIKSNNNRRFIWQNTQNNMTMLKHIQNALKSINTNNNNNDIAFPSQQTQSIQVEKTQQVLFVLH